MSQTVTVPILEQVDPSWALACIVDLETTGLDGQNDEIVEVGMILFAFDRRTATVLGIVDRYSGLREPTCPMSPGAVRKNHLTKKVLKGQRLDEERIASIAERAECFIAHYAQFDMAFAYRLLPVLLTKPWLCTRNDIDWHGHGFERRDLATLIAKHGMTMLERHRAGGDADAILALLKVPKGQGYLRELLHRGGARSGYQSGVAKPARGCGCGSVALLAALILVVWFIAATH